MTKENHFADALKFKIKKYFLISFGLCLSACNLSSPTMTARTFERIPIGMPTTEIEEQAGAPYRITSQGGIQQYYYIERLQVGPNSQAQNTYILTIKDGTIVDKQCSNESSPFNFQVR